jgi:DNA-binding CsgD family transcriptional regulator
MKPNENVEFSEGADANLKLYRVLPVYINNQIGATLGKGVAQIQETASKEDELQRCKADLENIKTELLNTNYALSTLARNLREEQHDLAQKITTNIAQQVLPAIDEIENSKIPEIVKQQLNIVRLLLNNVISISKGREESVIPVLSKAELRVANMIKNGLKTAAIAKLLYVSELTIKTHRRNIRKKLKIDSSPRSLSSTLKFIMDDSN